MSKIIAVYSLMLFGCTNINAVELPDEVKKVYKENNCIYEEKWGTEEMHAGGVNPPYVFGFIPGSLKNSIIFVCPYDSTSGLRKYKTYFEHNDSKHELSACPKLIQDQVSGRGLSIRENKTGEKLKGFSRFKEDGKVEKLSELDAKFPTIIYEFDGSGAEIYCHDGKWWFRDFH